MGGYPFDVLFVDVLSMTETHDYTQEGAGDDKLLVFVDSLSRWIELCPFTARPHLSRYCTPS